MKVLKTTIILMVAALFVFVGCEKSELEYDVLQDNEEKSEIATQKVDITYHIDDQPATEQEYKILINNNDDILRIHIITKTENAIYVYTSEEGYIDYGERNGLNLKGELEFCNHMSEYAESSGAIAEYEKTGNIPEHYTEYEREYYKKTFNNAGEKALMRVYDSHQGGSSTVLPIYTPLPTLGSWNDRISVVELIGAGTLGVTLFRKKFFLKRTTSFVLGLFVWRKPLYGDANNSTSSILTW
jgi:hypothetical protein